MARRHRRVRGMVWTSYFQANVLPAQPSVYVVDVNSAPAGCLTTWTAGRSQVELFRPGDNA